MKKDSENKDIITSNTEINTDNKGNVTNNQKIVTEKKEKFTNNQGDVTNNQKIVTENKEKFTKAIKNRKHKYDNITDLKYYIAGLFEGDGCVIMPNRTIKPKSGKIYPEFKITGNSKDIPLFDFLQVKFGHGNVVKRQGENTVDWTINNIEGLKKIIRWLNGKLYTPKLHVWNLFIDLINKQEKTKFKKKSLCTMSLKKNAWFCGFVDADGALQIRRDKGTYNGCMYLTQRRVDQYNNSYKPVMELIKNTFGFSLREITSKKLIPIDENHNETTIMNNTTNLSANHTETIYIEDDTNIDNTTNLNATANNELNINSTGIAILKIYKGYLVASENRIANAQLIEYLDVYPFLSYRYLDYLLWKEAIYIKEPGTKWTKEMQDKAAKLKSQMNSQRKVFTWDHLPKLSKEEMAALEVLHIKRAKLEVNRNIRAELKAQKLENQIKLDNITLHGETEEDPVSGINTHKVNPVGDFKNTGDKVNPEGELRNTGDKVNSEGELRNTGEGELRNTGDGENPGQTK
uniref:Homing endonuclease LAGLIDADG domain-containing protein n=1 Tax=Capsaspora owczarzaki TaxID=192875 RepID=M1K3D9_9EUKA|nr:hypothetical protein [Capsaspora owczarzaki]